MLAQQIFQHLAGKWSFQRCLNKQATMTGIAQFSKLNERSYYYQESGKVYHQKQAWHAYKNYVYTLQPNTITVHFWDAIRKQAGSLLHTLEFSSHKKSYPAFAYNTHICRADHYQAYYQFDSPTAFQLTYIIHGPKKNWLIKTSFHKIIAHEH